MPNSPALVKHPSCWKWPKFKYAILGRRVVVASVCKVHHPDIRLIRVTALRAIFGVRASKEWEHVHGRWTTTSNKLADVQYLTESHNLIL